MNRLTLGTTLLIFSVGCDNIQNAMVPLRPIIGELDMTKGTCGFDKGGDTMLAPRIDADTTTSYSLMIEVRNLLQQGRVNVSNNPPEVLERQNDIIPLRFDYRWECDSAFLSNTGPLIIPAFAVDRPFCFDNRDDTTKDFVGFDVIEANGGAIAAGETGLVHIRPGSSDFINALRDTFVLGKVADQCCRDNNGCSADQPPDTGLPSCAALDELFKSVGNGSLSIDSAENVDAFRPLAKFTESPLDSNNNPVGSTPVYPLRLRGAFEGVTSSGDIVTSSDWSTEVGVCLQGCGGYDCTDF